MLRFPREFRGYIADINFLAAARKEPLKFSYFFQLHLFVAFLLAITFTPIITDLIRSAASKLEKIPLGVTLEKKGVELSVTGVSQPYTLVDGPFVLTLDTTGTTKERPASSTVFVSKEALEVAYEAGKPTQHILWKDGGDFKFSIDEFRSLIVNHEAAAVIVLSLIVFVYFFVSSVVFSVILIVLWSALSSVMYGLVFHEKVSYRDALAFHMVAITGPVVLWGICVAIGLSIGPMVEVITFVVYSILGLRFGGRGAAPTVPLVSSEPPSENK